MHVAKGPIIETGSGEIAHGCGSVVCMTRLMPDIGVEHCNRIGSGVRDSESRRQIVGHALACVADAGDVGHFPAATDDRFGVRISAKRDDIRRKLKTASPTVQRVVISVNDEDGNVALGQTLHLLAERHERPKASVFRIIKITRNDQEVGFRLDRMVHHAIECAERGRL